MTMKVRDDDARCGASLNVRRGVAGQELLELIKARGLTGAAEHAETRTELRAGSDAGSSSPCADVSACSVLLAADAAGATAPRPTDYARLKMSELLELAKQRGIDEAEDAESRDDVVLMLEADDEARAAVASERSKRAPPIGVWRVAGRRVWCRCKVQSASLSPAASKPVVASPDVKRNSPETIELTEDEERMLEAEVDAEMSQVTRAHALRRRARSSGR